MSDSKRVQDLSLTELRALLNVQADLAPEVLARIEDFVEEIGGLDNARLAMELLAQLEDLADMDEGYDDLSEAA